MKNTLKSKTLWIVLALELIAIEPYIPTIREFLPPELAILGSFVLPALILLAKIARDQGLLTTVLSQGDTAIKSDEIKTKAKKAVKKRVVKKVDEKLQDVDAKVKDIIEKV